MKVELQRNGSLFVLTMKDNENRFNGEFIEEMNKALDEVEKSTGAAALITTGEGKFFSNGLDLNWDGMNPTFIRTFVEGLFLRILTFPIPTIAAINGYAFAGGCMLALAHDYRIMKTERGFMCMNEIDLGLPLTPGMSALLRTKLPIATLRDCILQGRRYNAEEAFKAGMIDQAVQESELQKTTISLGTKLAEKGGNREINTLLKQGIYKDAFSVLSSLKPSL